MTPSDIERFEAKLDRLTEAVTRLVVIEERQASDRGRIEALERRIELLSTDIAQTRTKLDTWVQRGIGMWAAACAAWTIYWQVRNG